MSFESGINPGRWGGKDGKYLGLIQFSPENQKRYGVTEGQTVEQQMAAVIQYLKDTGVKPGDTLANIYAAILAGDARKVNASDLVNGGIVANVTQSTSGRQFAAHRARAQGMLGAYGGEVQAGAERVAERKRALAEEVKDRERIAEQAKKYGEQLQQNLLTEQESSRLAASQADQISAIKAQGLSPEAEARAIAQVTAEIEKQKTVMMLMADAKRRNVDLDTLMTGSTMTYKQAIEALGEAKKADILATNERAFAEGKAAEAQAFMAQAQQSLEDGLLDAIVAGKSFSDVLGNLAQMLAKAALQAALFGSGPFGNGGGLLSVLFGSLFGRGDPLSAALRGAGLPARAMGGPVSAGQPYMVGERGPEPFVPAVNGRVLSVAQAQAALRGGQSGSGNVTIAVDVRGATGNQEVQNMVQAGVRQGLTAYDKSLPGRVMQISARPRLRN